MANAVLERLKFEAGTHKAPREAFRFKAPVGFQFAEGDDEVQSVPVRILARTPDVIDHWYLGRTINDMTGARFKEKIPLDWCHWWDVNVGFADEIDADEEKGLTLAGKIISVGDDQAAQILKRGKAGVPYEASIEFTRPWKFEVLGEGQVAECNGQTIEGPCIIFREWTLIACAICPFGADPNTQTKFSLAGSRRPNDEPDEIEFTIEPESIKMAKAAATPTVTQSTDSPADAPQPVVQPTPPAAVSQTAPTDDPAKVFAAKLTQFTAKFGPVNGSKWAAEGKTYEEGLELHAAELASQGDAKQKEIDDLKTRLAAVDKGEPSAVSFSEEGGAGGDGKSKHAKPGSNRAKFTAGVKLPAGWNGKK
jgi:hypothetical protein